MIASRSVPARAALCAALVGACLAAGAARAVVAPQERVLDVDRLSQDSWLRSSEAARVSSSLQRSPAWIAWSRQHPGWRVQWNARTRTAHRAYGPGARIEGYRRPNARTTRPSGQ